MYIGAVVAGGAMVASGGTLAGAFLAAAMAGGLAGSALAKLIDYHHADYLQAQLDKGGIFGACRTIRCRCALRSGFLLLRPLLPTL
jgi:hypothetical protein